MAPARREGKPPYNHALSSHRFHLAFPHAFTVARLSRVHPSSTKSLNHLPRYPSLVLSNSNKTKILSILVCSHFDCQKIGPKSRTKYRPTSGKQNPKRMHGFTTTDCLPIANEDDWELLVHTGSVIVKVC